MFTTDCIQSPLTKLFYQLGKVVARRRLWFLIMPIVATVLLAPSIFLLKTDGGNLGELFTPADDRAVKDRKRVERAFPNDINTTHFSALRLLEWNQYGIVAVTTKVRWL